MATELLTAQEAADRLGISRLTLYGWLGQSDTGKFTLRGQPVTIAYYQSGRRGQGKIHMETQEVQRLLELMRVTPRAVPGRKVPVKKTQDLKHITIKLGRPED